MSRKLVIVGGGSTYTPEIFEGIIQRFNKFYFEDIILVDINDGYGLKKAQIILELGQRMFKKANIPSRLSLTDNVREALIDADFVISQFRAGQMYSRKLDELTGIKLGILGQETTGVGGFLSAMRAIPQALELAENIKSICPSAWLINFTNPSGIITQAIHSYSRIKCVGLCNVPINMQYDIAKILDVTPNEVICKFAGLNHLSYITSVIHQGREVIPYIINNIAARSTQMKNIPQVEGSERLIQDLGLIPSPYLQYYYFAKEMLEKQKTEFESNGKTRADIVEELDRTLFEKYADPNTFTKPIELSYRGGSLYSKAAFDIIEALISKKPVELVINYLNNNAMPQLNIYDVVETNFLVSSDGIIPAQSIYLPEHVMGLVNQIKIFERLTVKAAVEKSKNIALQALLNHPLIGEYTIARSIMKEMEIQYKDLIPLRN